MKKKPLHSENRKQLCSETDASPQVGIIVETSKGNETSPTCSKKANAETKDTMVPVLSKGSGTDSEQSNSHDMEIANDDALVIQITASTSQIKGKFSHIELSEDEIEITTLEPELIGLDPFHFIGLGRHHKSQGTMVMAPMIGIAKRQGKIIVSH